MRDAKVPLEDIPLNSFHKKLTFYSAGGPFLDGYVLSILGVVMLQLTQDLQLSLAWQGLIAASALIGVFIGGFFGGWFTDKYGRKVLYLVDLIAIVVFSVFHLVHGTCITTYFVVAIMSAIAQFSWYFTK